MKRRDFFALSAGTALLPLNFASWAAEDRPRRLVVIMLRGAVDGLNVVVPHGERAYYEARPTIAIGRPGTDQGALPLDGHFGLHPALAGVPSAAPAPPRRRPGRLGRYNIRRPRPCTLSRPR